MRVQQITITGPWPTITKILFGNTSKPLRVQMKHISVYTLNAHRMEYILYSTC